MIVVRVELHSAVTGQVTELARMHICNVSGGGDLRHYDVKTLRGRGRQQLDHGHVQRKGSVTNWPAEQVHVWNLVAEALDCLSYGRRGR